MSRSSVLLVTLFLAALADSASAGRFLYLHDPDAREIHAFAMDTATGALTPVPGSPFANAGEIADDWNGNCQTIASAPARNALVTSGPLGLSVWSMASDGTLSLVPDSPFGDADGYVGVASIRVGEHTYVYAAERSRSRVHAFELLADGTLEDLDGSPVASGGLPTAMVAHGKILLAANEHGALTTYKVNKKGVPKLANGTPRALDVESMYTLAQDAKGKFVYVPSADDPEVHGFRVDAKGRLKPLKGSPFEIDVTGMRGLAFGWQGYGVVFDDTGDGIDDAQVVRIDLKSGVLETFGGPQSTGLAGVRIHGIDPSGLRVVAATGTAVHVLSLDPSTGLLAPVDDEALEATRFSGLVFVDR